MTKPRIDSNVPNFVFPRQNRKWNAFPHARAYTSIIWSRRVQLINTIIVNYYIVL